MAENWHDKGEGSEHVIHPGNSLPERNLSLGASDSVLKAIGFREELSMLLNKHSMENSSDTPDFILAEYLAASLQVYDRAVRSRDKWYGQPADRIGGRVPLPDFLKEVDAILANEQKYSREAILIVLAKTLNEFVLVQAEIAELKLTKGVADAD